MATTDIRGASLSGADPPIATNPNPDLAIKAPVRVATTGANINLQTIGLGVIDGVQLVAGDRVLVKDQTDGTTNGLYNASTGPWTRTIDAANNSQFATGTLAVVTAGAANAGRMFELTTANPITLGTSNLTFVAFTTTGKITLTQPATGATLTIADGKTLTASNTLTFTGTDGSSVAFGAGGTVLYANQTITLAGDVTGSGATAITTTLAAGNAGNLNSGTLLAARMPALTGDVTTSVGTVATTAAANILKRDATNTISKGYTLTPNNAGTVSSGTFTPDPTAGNYQFYTNNGAHTLAAPSSDCAIDILCTNGASAGTITFSGFTVGTTGDALDTTNAHKFILSIRRINAVATYLVKALQ